MKKYIKNIYEYSLYYNFQFNTKNLDLTIYYKDENIDHIRGTASVEWHLDFNFKGDKGVEFRPVIQSIKLYLYKYVYINDNFDYEEEYEELLIEKNINIEFNNVVKENDVLLLPYEVEYDYDKKTTTVYF